METNRMCKKGKICIVTNYRGTANYGAILQAYALNTYIRSLGYECQTLNYCVVRNDKKKLIKKYIFQHPITIHSVVLQKVQQFLVKKIIQLRRAVFDRFRNDLIPHTKECMLKNAASTAEEFDLLICGSDQIWRPSPKTGEFDDVMWLKPFPENIPKLSYAASLGVTKLDDYQSAYIREALKNYRAISVREESARELLEQICMRDIQVVLDPVFLLDCDIWKKFAQYAGRKKPYILLYFIQPKWSIYQHILRFAKRVDLDIIYIPYMNYRFDFPDFMLKGNREIAPTPQEFIGLINQAKYIFTDSFHGTAFSIMLHKNFYCFIRKNYGTRLINLLKIVGLEEQIVHENFIEEKELSEERWELVDKHLNRKREQSKMFLKQFLFEGQDKNEALYK